MRRLLLVAASALLLTGCAAEPAAPTETALSTIGTVEEFTGKVGAALREKKTAAFHGSVTDQHRAEYSERVKGSLRLEPSGQVSSFLTNKGLGGFPYTVITLPEATYVTAEDTAKYFPKTPWLQTRGDDDPELRYVHGALLKGYSWLREPSWQLGLFAAAAKLEGTTQDTAGNTKAVKYTFALDLAKAAAASKDKAVKAGLAERIGKGRTKARHDIWLDPNHLPLRWWVLEELPGNSTPATTDMHYQDWGKPVEITAPPEHRIR